MRLYRHLLILAALVFIGFKGVAVSLNASTRTSARQEEINAIAHVSTQDNSTDDTSVAAINEIQTIYKDEIEATPELPEDIKALIPDFDALYDINTDIVAWIYLPAIDISYPVLQGEDNEYYLKHNIDNEWDSTGSVILNTESSSDFSDVNTFIQAHAMLDGSMFGSLKSYIKNPDLLDKSPYIWIFTENHVYQYEIFAAYNTDKNSEMYINPDPEYHDLYVKKALEQSAISHDCDTTGKLLTLSTCRGVVGSGDRRIVHAALQCIY